LGLELTGNGFDFSVLSEFRTRVAGHGMEAIALDLLASALVDKGLIKPRGKQRTDSTHVLAGQAALRWLHGAAVVVATATAVLAPIRARRRRELRM
jgi:hypothetical protein